MNKTNKFILHIYDNIDEYTAFNHITTVIKEGRCSYNKHGDQYCFATTFTDNIMVVCDRNKNGTDIFYVYRRDDNENSV